MASLLNQILGIQQPGDPVDDQGLTQANRTQGAWGGVAQLGATLAAIGQPQTGAERAQAMSGFGKVPTAIDAVNKGNNELRNKQAATIHYGQLTENEKTNNLMNKQKMDNINTSLAAIDADNTIPAPMKLIAKQAIISGHGLGDFVPKVNANGLVTNGLTGDTYDIYNPGKVTNIYKTGGATSGGGGLAPPLDPTDPNAGLDSARPPTTGTTPPPGTTPEPGTPAPQGGLRAGPINTKYLATLDPGQAAKVQAVIEGRMTPAEAFGSNRSPRYQEGINQVLQAQPGFNSSTAKIRQDYYKQYLPSGKASGGNLGDTLVNNNTFVMHALDQSNKAEELPTSVSGFPGAQTLNSIWQGIRGGDTNPAVATYNSNLEPVVGEAGKASGLGDSVESRNSLKSGLAATAGPAAINASLLGLADKARERTAQKIAEYENATGMPMPPELKNSLQNTEAEKAYGQLYEKVKGKGSYKGPQSLGPEKQQQGGGQSVPVAKTQDGRTVYRDPDGVQRVR